MHTALGNRSNEARTQMPVLLLSLAMLPSSPLLQACMCTDRLSCSCPAQEWKHQLLLEQLHPVLMLSTQSQRGSQPSERCQYCEDFQIPGGCNNVGKIDLTETPNAGSQQNLARLLPVHSALQRLPYRVPACCTLRTRSMWSITCRPTVNH